MQIHKIKNEKKNRYVKNIVEFKSKLKRIKENKIFENRKKYIYMTKIETKETINPWEQLKCKNN